MDELRVVGIHAVADLGPSFLEVRGHLVLRQARRLSDYLNHPDPMLELDGGGVRFPSARGWDEWEEVEGLSLNRDRVLIVIPVDEVDPGPDPSLLVPARQVRVKLICRGVQVTGFATVPLQATISSYIHETNARFLAVQEARVVPTVGGYRPSEDASAIKPFCMVNREHIVACVETRPVMPGPATRPAQEESE